MQYLDKLHHVLQSDRNDYRRRRGRIHGNSDYPIQTAADTGEGAGRGRAPECLARPFESELPRICARLEKLVCYESPSDDAEGVSRLARWIRDELKASGVAVETLACPPRGEAVLARIGNGSTDRGTLLLGHHDTVWPTETLAEMPFRIADGRATGPGVFDMKGGIAVAMTVLEALAQEARPPPATLLLVPDEERRSTASRGLTLNTAKDHRRVLVLEPSLDGAAKVARKGVGFFEIRLRGRPAHAGLEPENGVSALAELAHCVRFLERLADNERGTSVTPTVARSGTTFNVVPETAVLSVDARAWTLEEAQRVEQAVRGYKPSDPRIEVEVDGGFDRPPLEPTPESQALYLSAKRIAAELGFELGAARVGGGSDGNFTAAAGIPTLDGLGPLGGGAHARDEFVVVSDLPRRAALLARLLTDSR